MKYVGNFKTWISPKIINTILESPGDRRPEENIKDHKKNLSKIWFDAGYNQNKIGWSIYDKSHFTDQLVLPEIFNDGGHWWFCKLNPGDVFPLHQDLYQNPQNGKRYWMACQDHHPGHIFFYKDKCLNNYSAGDLFVFENQNDWHGSCNIGFIPKISLQIICGNQ